MTTVSGTRLVAPLLALFLLSACGKDGGNPVDPGDSSIVLVNTLAVPSNYGLHDQYVRDGVAFLSAWNSGLRIYDVGGGGLGGSPSNPVLIGSVVTSANGVSGGPAVHNAWWYHGGGQQRYVFIGQEGPGSIGATSAGDIHVVDVSDMTAPVEVAFYHMAGQGLVADSAGAHNFWVDEQNEILYAAYYSGGVVALDVSGTLSGNLASREIARFKQGGALNTYLWGVQLVGSSLYASDMLSGLWQLRLIGNTFQAVSGGNNVPERFGGDLWVSNGFAYTGTWGGLVRAGNSGNALKIWQLGAGGVPVLVDSLVISGVQTISDVEVSADGSLLMLSAEGGSQAGLYFYDLAVNRAAPPLIARYPVATGVHTATLAEIGGRRYAFAAKNPGSPALLILDITGISP